ncbi:MAG: hypothetical protein ACU0AT_09260 [Tranquillimonas sp.]
MPYETLPDATDGPNGRPATTAIRIAVRPQRAHLAVGTLMLLAACAGQVEQSSAPTPGFVETLPEEVIALAAPYQNLQAVRLAEDGCYWYQHIGQVETTMLPLRTVGGQPICYRAAGS